MPRGSLPKHSGSLRRQRGGVQRPRAWPAGHRTMWVWDRQGTGIRAARIRCPRQVTARPEARSPHRILRLQANASQPAARFQPVQLQVASRFSMGRVRLYHYRRKVSNGAAKKWNRLTVARRYRPSGAEPAIGWFPLCPTPPTVVCPLRYGRRRQYGARNRVAGRIETFEIIRPIIDDAPPGFIGARIEPRTGSRTLRCLGAAGSSDGRAPDQPTGWRHDPAGEPRVRRGL